MKLYIANNQVRIESAGLEFLKLKAALSARLGGILQSEKSAVLFPPSALPWVRDLLNFAEQTREVSDILQTYDMHVIAREKILGILESQSMEGVSEEWKERLEPAQASAVAAMILPNLLGLCLFDEQGSGKTVMTIGAFDILKEASEIDAMIVVCPKTMMSEWPKDIDKFLPNKFNVTVTESGSRSKFYAALNDFDVLVTNYEGVAPMLTPLAANASRKRYLLVVDESYYVKNEGALRAEAVTRLRGSCRRCFILCGTPAPNSAYDLINQFNLADTGFTFADFKKTKDIVADRNQMSDLIETRGALIRRLKTEILQDVPEKNFHIIRIPLKGRQALLYEKARADLELALKRMDNTTFKRNLTSYFARRAVLMQICTSPTAIDPTYSDVPVKYKVLDDLLADLIGHGRKVVLWSFYKNSLNELLSRYSAYNPWLVDGSVDVAMRRDAVKSFQEDTSRMLFIGNPAAAGAGITLHASYDAVYVSYSNQAAHYLQSLDRIHRRGQKSKEVNYHLLVCEGTVEETEVVRLRGKELQQHLLLGDHVPWPSSLDEALKELSGHV